jgi:hypothetical protein
MPLEIYKSSYISQYNFADLPIVRRNSLKAAESRGKACLEEGWARHLHIASSFLGLFPEFFQLLSLALQFPLVLFDLLIQVALLFFQRLHSIADQRSGTEPQRAAYCGTRSRMTNGTADNTSGGGAAYGADGRSLLPCG